MIWPNAKRKANHRFGIDLRPSVSGEHSTPYILLLCDYLVAPFVLEKQLTILSQAI